MSDTNTRTRGNTLVVAVITVVIAVTGFSLGIVFDAAVAAFFNSLPSERINIASQMLIQFASFLTAGWAIAFFQYWKDLEKAMRESRRSRLTLRQKDEQVARANTLLGEIYRLMQKREKEYAPSRRLFAEAITSVLVFIAAAFTAVTSVLTADGFYVLMSLVSLAIGVVLMIASWFDLWTRSKRLRTLPDLANVFGIQK